MVYKPPRMVDAIKTKAMIYIQPTSLDQVLLISRPVFEDDRGFFREVYRVEELNKTLGFEFTPVQTNHSRSSRHTLRGIHTAPWHKLVTVLRGEVQQVVVDLRTDSKTFGSCASFLLGENNWHSVFVPTGCGNAF